MREECVVDDDADDDARFRTTGAGRRLQRCGGVAVR